MPLEPSPQPTSEENKENTMSTNLSPDGGGMLPVTGFGPGTILVAVIGGALTLGGLIMRRLGQRRVAGTA
jgi:hypothetical protein